MMKTMTKNISKADLDFYGERFFNPKWFKEGVIEPRENPERDKEIILNFDRIWDKHKHHFILDIINELYLKRIVLVHLFDAKTQAFYRPGTKLTSDPLKNESKWSHISSLEKCVNTAKHKHSWECIAVNRPSVAEVCFDMAPEELQIKFIKMVCGRIRTGDTSYYRKRYKDLSKELYDISTTFKKIFKIKK